MVLAGALTERGHHLAHQTIEPFPVDTFAAPHRLGARRRPPCYVPHPLLTHRLIPRGSVSGPKPSTTTLLIIDEAGMAGINPQDPRATGETQLETLPALWKQRLDRHIARATNPSADPRADKPHAGRTALSPRDVRQRPYQRPQRRPSGPSAPSR